MEPAVQKIPQKTVKGASKMKGKMVSSSSSETKPGIEAKKGEDFHSWYTQVVTRSEMMDYYDISGCYIFRPWSFRIWKEIQSLLTYACTL